MSTRDETTPSSSMDATVDTHGRGEEVPSPRAPLLSTPRSAASSQSRAATAAAAPTLGPGFTPIPRPNQNASSSFNPATTPNRTSQTHLGGILPPASFFRPSRPNSTASSAMSRPNSAYNSPIKHTVSPTASSPLRGLGIGLPFKSPASPPPAQNRGLSSLPSTLKSPVAVTGPPRLPLGKQSREPLLPIGDRSLSASAHSKMADTSTSAADVSVNTSAGAGVRGSFERLFKKATASLHGSHREEDTRSWVDPEETELNSNSPAPENDLEAAVAPPSFIQPETIPEEEPPRNKFVQETSEDMKDPAHLSVYDLDDSALGGGVVMEMGRLSMADSYTARPKPYDEESVVESSVAPRGPSMSLDGGRPPRTPGGGMGVAVSFSFDDEAPPRPSTIDSPLPPPDYPSRHTRFAPSPRRSPKAQLTAPSVPDSSVSLLKHRLSATSPPYMVPVLSPKSSKPIRNHSFHPSRNHFFFSGRILAGGDSALPFIGALILLFGIAGTWFATTCVFWWHYSPAGKAVAIVGAYLTAITVSSMLMTAFKDPGILPRDLDPDPPCAPTTSGTSESSPVPLPRDLRVRAGTVRVKYCVTCKTYRPPRSSHCKMCDNCVDGCDHHCQWVNNCVGRRNYTHFITFVVTASITGLLVLVTGILHIYLLARRNHYSVREAFQHAIGSAIAVGMCLIVIWPLLALTLYHIRLLLLNITTIEQVRNQAHRKLTNAPTAPNPFSIGHWWHNVAYLLCRPAGYTWVELSGYAMHDTRKVNPGFIVRPASTIEGDTLRSSREGEWQ